MSFKNSISGSAGSISTINDGMMSISNDISYAEQSISVINHFILNTDCQISDSSDSIINDECCMYSNDDKISAPALNS